MPVDRPNGRVLKAEGQMTTHEPGAYAYVLEKLCEQDALKAAPCYLTLADDEAPAWHRDNAERKARLMAERNGQALRVQRYMLPRGLHAPFDRWPSAGQRGMFVVTPDDEIRFVPREAERTA
jgi:hypothetical protein